MTLMPLGEDGWPSRAAVRVAWQAVIAGKRTRESVHDWSVPLMVTVGP
jgi:predicted secreted Zn-dependent protease